MQVLAEIGGKGVRNLQQNHVSAVVKKVSAKWRRTISPS